MVRGRLTLVALAGSLLLTVGCHHFDDHHCHETCFFNRFRLAQRHRECDCVHSGVPVVSAMPASSGPVLVTPDAAMQPHYQPGMTPFAPPPRIVPVPQANPMPYTPK